ncbi:hypothetical protein JGH11_02825 [Dysgonomonas sp. Marseille-P4677]|uniref:SGNH/GDSL hydrolase family protein n=1 Tax=Dysgonomonas sp. Marseille-P4677 TaxID=2364790 RepID=UPI001911850A|nr:hypothetical protein [Dysgonomonas sp. Marseille-P4677]MBK5719802.1 hypothetical protein [Dysgonomonas sp. Marseille-P4677]
MGQQTIPVLKEKFADGKTPPGSDFADLIDSYIHKSTKINQAQVLGLNESLNDKATKEDLKNATTNFKGYHTDLAALLLAYPQAQNKKDFFAWVGSPYPGTVYKVFADGGAWTDTGEVPTQEEIDLAEYAKKEEVDIKFNAITTGATQNIHIPSTDTKGYYLELSGTTVTLRPVAVGYYYTTTDYIEVNEGDVIDLVNDLDSEIVARSVVFYAQKGNVCLPTSKGVGVIGNYRFSVPSGAKYFRCDYSLNCINFRVLFGGLVIRQSALPDDVNNSVITVKTITQEINNLFDKNAPDVMAGKYLNLENGLPSGSNPDYYTTGFIDVSELIGEPLVSNCFTDIYPDGYFRFACFYDADKNFIAGQGYENRQFLYVPQNAVYFRSCFNKIQVSLDNYAVVSGNTRWGITVKETALPKDVNDAVSTVKALTQEQPNLFDKNDADIVYGKYLNTQTGLATGVNEVYCTTGFIDISKLIGKTLTSNIDVFRFACFYDAGKNFIAGQGYENQPSILVPQNAAYFRTCFNYVNTPLDIYFIGADSASVKIQLSAMPNEVLSLIDAGNLMPIIRKDVSLAAGQYVEIPLKMGNHLWTMSCLLSFNAFSAVRIGKGRTTYQGAYFRIDATKLYVYSTGQLIDTVNHGLTINKSLMIYIEQVYDKTHIYLASQTGNFSYTSSSMAGNYSPFVEADGGAVTVDAFNFDTTPDLSKKILFIADSYGGGQSIARTPGCLYLVLNIQSFMTSNMSGGNASELYSLLQTALSYSKPKFVIWGSGMNDNSFATWKSITEQAITLIEKSGAEPILITIPSVPTRDKTEINTYVRASGYRYIDFSLAVSDDAGNWFAGLLHSDGVHPTELGAYALAMRALTDLPELIKYNNN